MFTAIWCSPRAPRRLVESSLLGVSMGSISGASVVGRPLCLWTLSDAQQALAVLSRHISMSSLAWFVYFAWWRWCMEEMRENFIWQNCFSSTMNLRTWGATCVVNKTSPLSVSKVLSSWMCEITKKNSANYITKWELRKLKLSCNRNLVSNNWSTNQVTALQSSSTSKGTSSLPRPTKNSRVASCQALQFAPARVHDVRWKIVSARVGRTSYGRKSRLTHYNVPKSVKFLSTTRGGAKVSVRACESQDAKSFHEFAQKHRRQRAHKQNP